MSGYDETRAPQLDLIGDCVHCGFCLPTCPTYVLWGEEMDSPRGRIVLMKEGHEEISAPLMTHLDRCLGCMACVTACPSGVQYDKLIEDARPQLERNLERPPLERAHRRLIFELFTRPGRLRALAPGAALAQKLGLPRVARRPRVRRLAPRLAAMVSMTPESSMRRSLSRLPERFEARGERRGTVALLQGCVQRVFFAQVNEATARVLAAEGFEVHAAAPAALLRRACAARRRGPPGHDAGQGDDRGARDLRHGDRERRWLRLGDEGLRPPAARRARRGPTARAAFSARVRDVSEFLAEAGPRAERRPIEMKVAYHDACHLAHAQGVRTQPRELLRGIPGLELVEPADWELCCGSAGIYNLVQPRARGPAGRAQGA